MSTPSIGAQIKQIAGLAGTRDVTKWESEFIDSVVWRTDNGHDTRALTEKQLDVIERIWSKHFA